MKPADVTFEQAASVPVAAYTALQGLRDKGQIQPGQKVLINGAAGGVGTFAVQIAKPSADDLTIVCELMQRGQVRPVIDRRYTLSEVPGAIRYVEAGHARGKVVITVD
jgi:NADPH:quinone reductase-like Zn-dependent oxidoreductase